MPNIKAPGNTVLLFESDAGWNASGDQGAMIARPRHSGGFIILFADGHVEAVPRERLRSLIWNPQQSESPGEPL
jgi:prepilin-type processing-associated H-X9-DG protein